VGGETPAVIKARQRARHPNVRPLPVNFSTANVVKKRGPRRRAVQNRHRSWGSRKNKRSGTTDKAGTGSRLQRKGKWPVKGGKRNVIRTVGDKTRNLNCSPKIKILGGRTAGKAVKVEKGPKKQSANSRDTPGHKNRMSVDLLQFPIREKGRSRKGKRVRNRTEKNPSGPLGGGQMVGEL